ncbi:hypothetical protein [Leifsonia sp. fls2-241-R2A-40a]|uniref:hypothetical protein n=1 Tax=Leifsonia sp. fls2-241-R2A-40a TaxID=3040290 RepID=UPI00254EDE02|nr:hypothetical protein [Leifsonia sp. fls2-241-R2A-40a]
MIAEDIARQLRAAGLRWQPASGDTFAIDRPGMEGERFTVSDMTIEPHHFDTGTILGFNGTTEWALDSLAVEDALWIPREDQLRELLRGTFRHLARTPDGYRVTVIIEDQERFFEHEDAASAYAQALLSLIGAAVS